MELFNLSLAPGSYGTTFNTTYMLVIVYTCPPVHILLKAPELKTLGCWRPLILTGEISTLDTYNFLLNPSFWIALVGGLYVKFLFLIDCLVVTINTLIVYFRHLPGMFV